MNTNVVDDDVQVALDLVAEKLQFIEQTIRDFALSLEPLITSFVDALKDNQEKIAASHELNHLLANNIIARIEEQEEVIPDTDHRPWEEPSDEYSSKKGAELRARRLALGKDVRSAAREVGISPKSIWNWEQGRLPTIKTRPFTNYCNWMDYMEKRK